MGTRITKYDLALQKELVRIKDSVPVGETISASGVQVNDRQILEYPIVSPEEFILSNDYYGADQRDELHPDVFPCILEDMNEIFSGPNYAPKYRTFVDIEGTGSGKSTKAALFTVYSIYRLHCYADPARALDLKSGSIIAFMNMAPTAPQAKRLVFTRIGDAIKKIKVFTDRGWIPNPKVESCLEFPKRILVVPGNSSKSFSLGYDLYGGVIDEAEHFTESVTIDPVQEIYEQLNGRRDSRFHTDGLIVLISDARTQHCYLEQLAAAAKNDTTILFKRRTRWEANPKHKGMPTFSFSVNIPTPDGQIEHRILKPPEIYRKDFEDKPSLSLRTIAAIPTLTLSPFFANWEKVIESVHKSQMREDPCPDNGSGVPFYPEDAYRQLPITFKGDPQCSYFVHVDLARSRDGGIKSDCAGLAIAHRGMAVEREKMAWSSVVLDLAIRFKGSSERPVSFGAVREFLYNLHKVNKFRFNLITFDQWQSIESIDEMGKVGFNVEKRSVGISEFILLRDLMYGGRFDWYSDQWLLHELQTLEDCGDAIKATLGGHDDESFAVAGAVANALNMENVQTQRAKRPIMVNGILSGGGGQFQPGAPTSGAIPLNQPQKTSWRNNKSPNSSWRK